MMKRAIVLVLDGVGIGELPDAHLYGDEGSNTLGNLARNYGGLALPNLQKFGLGNISDLPGVAPEPDPLASYGKMAEQSPGKDSTSGHWELFGVILDKPFPTFPHGFPNSIIVRFQEHIGRQILGNIPASGTEIIKRLGNEHLRTKKPIVYTSADSVFQIAGHVDIIPLEELYSYCQVAREILQGEHAVARVIARPFAGQSPRFYRTKDRRDFSLLPPEPTLLDIAKKNGLAVIAIGKIDDIMGQRGYTEAFHSVNDNECTDFVLQALSKVETGLIVANFVQFDMDWGHRNDPNGFINGLIDMDRDIGRITRRVTPDDMLFVTADHGNDPTTPSTDHSREYVPILVLCPGAGRNLGIRRSFSDLAKTIAHFFDLDGIRNGETFLNACRA